MKKSVTFFVGLLIMIGALLACGADSNTNTGTTSTSSTQTTDQQQPAKHFKVGETVKVGDTWEITVNKVSTSSGADFITPPAGKKYLLVNVTVKNISNKEQVISSIANFTLKNADGEKANNSILVGGNTTPAPDGKVAAGDKAKGDLVYEIKQSDKNFTLAFEADIIASGQTIWDLKA
ncbi:DUF4352 domain-containing protein [Ktedonospora formicarum]|uniref:DUF4352 domain-containing protein n=1 Tax=Ktedonospora formicarum TaxID=2778364 RepID=A0A8J3I0I3_9CHLR|nr:DUF4352 domain-containing protein [Ktedonospora formicarum]GHO44565.1 hypothetical protein KSX_27280 [Ktedonospora formicarum]